MAMADEHDIEKLPTRVRILREIEIFLANNPSVSPEGFGWRACKNTVLVSRLRKGADINTSVLDKILAYLANPN